MSWMSEVFSINNSKYMKTKSHRNQHIFVFGVEESRPTHFIHAQNIEFTLITAEEHDVYSETIPITKDLHKNNVNLPCKKNIKLADYTDRC